MDRGNSPFWEFKRKFGLSNYSMFIAHVNEST